MNNNYHTQINGANHNGVNPNLLNEIAANNHLLQQSSTGQAFQGTPINHPDQNQTQYQRPTPHYPNNTLPQSEQEGYPGKGGYQESSVRSQLHPYAPNNPPVSESGIDIELTEQDNQPVIEKSVIKNDKVDTRVEKMQIVEAPTKSIQPASQPTYITIEKKNNITDYLLNFIVLAILFIVLVHPKTSIYFEKYLPPLTSIKGVAIRGVILATVFTIISFLASFRK
jgi:hypothetical protein